MVNLYSAEILAVKMPAAPSHGKLYSAETVAVKMLAVPSQPYDEPEQSTETLNS